MTSNPNSGAVFDRQRSGYVRDFNAFDVFVFNVLGFSLGLALSTNPAFIGAFAPSSSLVLVLLLGAVLALVNGLTYGWFGAIMPSTGGDFVFVSRSINHRLGFLTSWGFTACQIYGLTINVGWILTVGVAPALVTLGVSLDSPRLVAASVWLSQPMVVALSSVVLIAGYLALSYSEIALKKFLIYPLFVIALLGPVLMAWILYTHTNADFVNSFNMFMQKLAGKEDAYQAVISVARASGTKVDPALMWHDSLQAVPLGFLCFLGFTYSVYVGGEVIEPRKAQVRGIICALVLGLVVFLLCMSRYVQVVGQEFNSALLNPDVGAQIGPPGFSMNLLTGILSPSPVLNVVMQIGILVWFLLVPYVILEVCTHNVVAWSCDRLIPQVFNKRSKSTNAPWVAALAVCLFALLFIASNYLFGISLIGAVALVGVAFFITGIAAVNLPRRNPSAFLSAPPLAQKRFLGLSLFQWAGLLSAGGFAWITYAAVHYPMISGDTSNRAWLAPAMVLGTYALGLIVYEVGKTKLRKIERTTGVNLDALFREIPED